MLLSIRRGATTMAFKIIIALFIVALIILFSLGDYIGAFHTQEHDPVVYKVEDTAITERQLSHNITNAGLRLRSVIPGGLDTPEKIKQANIHELAISQVLNPIVSQQEFQRLGLVTSQAEVASHIARDEQFRGSDGRFSNVLYDGLLSQIGHDNNSYRRQVATQLTGASVTSALGFTPALLPASISNEVLTERLEERQFETVLVPRDQVTEPVPTEDDLRAFLADNPDRFELGEMRAATVLLIDPADLSDGIEISEEQLQKAFEERSIDFVRAETRSLTQITFDSEQEALDAVKDLAADATLADLAAKTGKGIASLPASQSVQGTAHGDAGFNTALNAISQPFESDFGWHVVSVDNITPAVNPSLDDLRGTLTETLQVEAASAQAEEIAIEVDKLVGEGAPLEEIAEQLNLNLRKIEPVTEIGFTASRVPAPNVPRDPKLLSDLFSTPLEETSFLNTTNAGASYVLRVDAIEKPRQQTFEEAKSRLGAMVKRDMWTKALIASAEDLITSGKDLPTLATELGQEVEISGFVSRSTLSTETTPARFLVDDAFTQPTSDAIIALPAGSNVMLVKLLEVKEQDLSQTENGQQVLQSLSNQYQNELAVQYQNALREKADVSVSQAALDRAIQTSARQLR